MARTRACKKCGEVIFHINPMGENTELICDKCKSKQYIYSGKYITCDKTCSSCYNDLFRVKVIDLGDGEKVTLECSECKGSPRTYYIDRDGNSIDRSTREILILQDKVEIIENSVSNLESRIFEIEYKAEYVEEDIERMSDRINNNKEDLSSIEQDVDWISKELDRETSRLKREIDDLNDLLNTIDDNTQKFIQ